MCGGGGMNQFLCCLCIILTKLGSYLIQLMSASINPEDVPKTNFKSKHLGGSIVFFRFVSHILCVPQRRLLRCTCFDSVHSAIVRTWN